MKGINFLIDETGKKKAVVIDLEEWGDEWEDFYDGMISALRKDEELIPWEKIKNDIAAEAARGR